MEFYLAFEQMPVVVAAIFVSAQTSDYFPPMYQATCSHHIVERVPAG